MSHKIYLVVHDLGNLLGPIYVPSEEAQLFQKKRLILEIVVDEANLEIYDLLQFVRDKYFEHIEETLFPDHQFDTTPSSNLKEWEVDTTIIPYGVDEDDFEFDDYHYTLYSTHIIELGDYLEDPEYYHKFYPFDDIIRSISLKTGKLPKEMFEEMNREYSICFDRKAVLGFIIKGGC